jgi:hypothetical protein
MTIPARPSISQKIKRQASVAGAKTDIDLALFADLANRRTQVAKMIRQWEPGAIPPSRWMLMRCDFLLQRGQFYQAQPLPKGFRRGRAKQCYDNSFNLTRKKAELSYCEGFVTYSFGKGETDEAEHAWCVAKDGKVIDVTLPVLVRGVAYFGVIFTPEEFAIGDYALPIIDEIIDQRMLAEL